MKISNRAKFWLASCICILLIGWGLFSFYEFLRHQAKAKKAVLREASIKLEYVLSKNESDIYGFSKKFARPDNYDFNKIKKYWDATGFMYWVPYTMFHYRPNARTPVLSTNSLGFRGKDDFSYLSPVDFDRKFRYIILLGGSAAFGAYSSSDDRCISGILEQKLNSEMDSNRPFKVINLGMGFYNSFQELVSYLLYGLEFDPEIVITFDGFNDCAVPLLQGKESPLATGMYFKTKQLIDDVNKKTFKKNYNEVKDMFISDIGAWDIETCDYAGDVSRLYKRNLSLICLMAKERGSKVILALQPVKVFPDGKFAWEDKRVEEAYKLLPGLLSQLSSEYGAQFLDFQKIFRENMSFNQYFATDPVHLNDRGQEIIATYIFGEIRKIFKYK